VGSGGACLVAHNCHARSRSIGGWGCLPGRCGTSWRKKSPERGRPRGSSVGVDQGVAEVFEAGIVRDRVGLGGED
jgi:hypothetical protein